MVNAIIIFPNNLFDPLLIQKYIQNKHIEKNNSTTNDTENKNLDVVMIEHPVFWGKRDDRDSMNFNPLKLVYHRASMYHWYNVELVNANKSSKSKINMRAAKYISMDEFTITKCKSHLSKYNTIYYFDPCDKQLDTEIPTKLIADTKTKHRAVQLDNPLFYNTLIDLKHFHADNTKNGKKQATYNHASFYKWMRNRVEFLPGTKTYDTENRNKMPLDTKVPALPSPGFKKPGIAKALQQGATASGDVNRHNVVSRLVFPIDHDSSIKWLRNFCKVRLDNFGKYQDAIDSKGREFLFHSCISPMLNIGLITPHDVIHEVQKYYESHKTKIPISSYEGFMRQVVGWREYQRYLYQYAYADINGTNHFNNKRRLPKTIYCAIDNNNQNDSQNNEDNSNTDVNPWYHGTTGIPPVDDAIKQAWRTGYLHHIQRLMVMGNLMNLVGVHPDDVYKWFMEFALDSYDWVMVGNVYSMALWADAGVSMRKPYISSDAYIMKMSTYKKGEWNDTWYALFYDFVRRNSKQLSSTYYAGMVTNWKKKSSEEKKELQKTADKFIKATTN